MFWILTPCWSQCLKICSNSTPGCVCVCVWKNENSNMKRYVHFSVHKSTISNHKGMETTCTSINGGLPKRMGHVCVCVCVCVCTFSGILFGHKK